MNLTVIGTGYVGLVSGVCLASRGHRVTCVDKRPEVVDKINRAEPPIHEDGLPELLKQEVQVAGRLRATIQLAEALENADLILLAVGTPSDAEGKMDVRFLEAAVKEVGNWFRTTGRQIPLVVKSTVLPGTTDTLVAGWLAEASGLSKEQLQLGMNPEFLREGQAVGDFLNPDRIVLGATDSVTATRLSELYASWDCDKLETNPRTAEMIKYANNALLALQISAANELANLATAIGGVDIAEVMQGVYLDHRWNPLWDANQTASSSTPARANPKILTYLKPGCGFGGSCFPKDVSALKNRGQELGLPMHVFEAVLQVNRLQPAEVIRLLERAVGDQWSNLKIGVLGMAFKPGTDDIRESASLVIVQELLNAQASVSAHDPVALEPSKAYFSGSDVVWQNDWQRIAEESDVLIVATAWEDYRELPGLLQNSPQKVVVDPRRFFQPDQFPNHRYYSIGLNPG